MKIADRTPFRTESGAIDMMGRVQGTLKYGLSWYARLHAQDVVIAVLDKVLGTNFILLRNVTLPDTDIDLPMVLIGPPGIYLINVIHERGVYRARDEEWGTIAAEKFVPAGINQLQRTVKLGRVLQVYLDRAGYKNQLIVEPILMAAEPGMHIESVRPAARIVMSDALERFAISMNQAQPSLLDAETILNIAHVIVNGTLPQKSAAPAVVAANTAMPANSGRDTTDALFPSSEPQDASQAFSADALGFSFDENARDQQTTTSSVPQAQRPVNRPPASPQKDSRQNQNTPAAPDFGEQNNRGFQENGFRGSASQDGSSQPFETQDAEATTYDFFKETPESDPSAAQSEAVDKPKSVPAKKRKLFGMSMTQVFILGGILLCWLCAMLAFAAYIYYSSLNV